MANPVSLLQSKRQEQPSAKHTMTCGPRKTFYNDGKLERSQRAIAITGSENSSRPTGTARCMHAYERWSARIPCAERPPWPWVQLQSKPRGSEMPELRHVALCSVLKHIAWMTKKSCCVIESLKNSYIYIYRHIHTHVRTLIHQRRDLWGLYSRM